MFTFLIDNMENSTVAERNTHEHSEEEDDPTEMPVPQVKVGPNGHLILDEQSLIIQKSRIIKNKKALAKSQAIIDDEESLGRGFYKKRKKVQKWSKWETIKFYKVLSLVGTDFQIMKSLFSNRSRDEIKMKYKKEEKINKKLIEKALNSELEFNIDILKKDLKEFDKFEESLLVSEIKTTKRRKLSRRITVTSLGDAGESDAESSPSINKRPRKKIKPTVVSVTKCKVLLRNPVNARLNGKGK